MATFTVKFDTDNAAFDEPNFNVEIVRILHCIAETVEREGCPNHWTTIFDANGNDVGRWTLVEH